MIIYLADSISGSKACKLAMEIRFREVGIILIFVFLASTVHAENLCDLNCTLSISFPTGGTIEAVESLTITFGDGGLVDTAGSVTAYLDGETLILNANESLVFGSGGRFDIGTFGNFDYTNLAITTGGTITLIAEGGDEQIQIPADGKLSFLGGAAFNLNSSIVNSGTLEIGTNTSLNVFGPGAPSGCEITSSSGATISVNGSNSVTIDNNLSCNTTYTLLLNSPILVAGTLTIVDTESNTAIGTLTLDDTSVINTAGPLTLLDTEEDAGAGTFSFYFLILLFVIWSFKCYRNRTSLIGT